jgi:hypothetical protein
MAIVCLFATRVGQVPGAADSPRVLFDPLKADAKSIETTDANIALVAKPGLLRVMTGHESQWPGIKIVPPEGKWDLSAFEALSIPLRNPEPEALTVSCRVDSRGADGRTSSVTETKRLEPGSTATLRMRIYPTPLQLTQPAEIIGMRRGPVVRPKIDPANVTGLLLFVTKPETAHRFEVGAIVANGQVKVLDAKTFFPFIDEFGQFIHSELSRFLGGGQGELWGSGIVIMRRGRGHG